MMSSAVRYRFCGLLLAVAAIGVAGSLAAGAASPAGKLVQLEEANWRKMLDGEWMVEFYAPWCPACKGLQKAWESFASWSKDLDIHVGQVDVTKDPGLSGRFMVTVLPTIFHIKKGEFRQYKGSRDKESFMSFIEEKKWQSLEPVPSWKAPDSLSMSAVSAFFKLSQYLRSVHTRLMDEFGLPAWASYLIFALATIILGALLGLVLVYIMDIMYPSLKKSMVPKDERARAEKADPEVLPDEEIKDDLIDDVNLPEKENSDTEDAKGEKSPKSSPAVRKRKPRKAD